MKKNETVQSLYYLSKTIYNESILGGYPIYFCHLFRNFKAYKDLSYPILLKGDLDRVKSKFIIRRPDLGVYMFYEFIESTITDYYSKFKFHIYKTIPKTFEFIHQLEYYYLNEDECLIFSSLIYNNEIIFTKNDLKTFYKFQTKISKTIEGFMMKSKLFKISVAYTIININIELIWKIIRNMKMIHKYINLLSDEIEYDGEILKKNKIIKLIKGDGKGHKVAIVKECKMVKYDSIKECVIELLFQKENGKNYIGPFSESKIVIRIYEYNGINTIYLFHFFVNRYEYTEIQKFTKIRNKKLSKFKDIIEHYIENKNLI